MQTRIVGEPDLVRDDNNVIRNTNGNDYRAHLNRRNAAIEQKRRMEALETDNKSIKATLDLILQLLQNKDSK